MHLLNFISSNYIINISFTSWVIAQLIKIILTFLFTKKVVFERLIGSGGMPSSHSATVCALAVGMAKKVGFESVEFALAIIFAGVVMYDAMGVRRAAGEQAKVINHIIKHLRREDEPGECRESDSSAGPEQIIEQEDLFNIEKQVQKFEYFTKLKEFIGHTPMEVLAGAMLGILVAMVTPVK